MSLNLRLQELLNRERVRYETLPHPDAGTSHAVAVASHVAARSMAKVVVLRNPDHGYFMAVLPASHTLDLARFRKVTGVKVLELATERELETLFPDCEIGAMPPFGRLYGVPVYLDECFRREGKLVFQGGNHHEAVSMDYRDFVRLAAPRVAEFCIEGGFDR